VTRTPLGHSDVDRRRNACGGACDFGAAEVKLHDAMESGRERVHLPCSTFAQNFDHALAIPFLQAVLPALQITAKAGSV